MKKIIPILVFSHLLCILLGFWLGKSQKETAMFEENAVSTETIIEITVEPTVETVDTVMTDEETSCPTEEIPAETEAESAPSDTTPPTSQPPATIPPATEPPVIVPPATEPPATTPPVTEPPVTVPPATEPPVTAPPAPGIDEGAAGEWE